MLEAEVASLTRQPLRNDLTGADVTTYRIGGPLPRVVTVHDTESAKKLLAFFAKEAQEYRVLGAGSNLLIGDAGFDGWIVRLGTGFRSVESLSGARFRIGGAASFMSLSRDLSQDGLSGLEFAGGIPALLGGAVYMNAGAHGSEICDRVETVSVVTAHGSYEEIAKNQLAWRYRFSGLPDGTLVVGAVLALAPGDVQRIQERRTECLNERRKRQPLSQCSAGSVFKNPSPSEPAGMVIESVGLKGKEQGGARISELHANWIVNPNRTATAGDVRSLVTLCRQAVKAEKGIDLEPEIKAWGFHW